MSLHSCHPLFYERPSRWLFTGKVSSQCRRIHIYIYAVNIRGFAGIVTKPLICCLSSFSSLPFFSKHIKLLPKISCAKKIFHQATTKTTINNQTW